MSTPVVKTRSPMYRLTAMCVALALCLGGVGCTNIENDATRTKTEGTLTGAGIGAAVGAGIGAIFGKGKGALIGAAIGAGVGSMAGYFVGAHVADKKAEYASREDWLDACIARTQEVTAETAKYNEQLKKDIAALNKETKALTAKRNKIDAETKKAEREKIEGLRNDTKSTLASLDTELSKQKQVLADARQNGNTKEAKALDAEIKKLQKQVNDMKAYNKQLASISARVAV